MNPLTPILSMRKRRLPRSPFPQLPCAPLPHQEYWASDVIQVPWNQSAGSALQVGTSMPFGIQANVMQMSVPRAPVPSLGSPGCPCLSFRS